MIAVITGSASLDFGRLLNTTNVKTEFGVSEILFFERWRESVPVVLRHGRNHSIPPHKINYKANISSLKSLGVSAVIGVYAVGIISDFSVGDIAVAEDFSSPEFPITFFDDFSEGARHTDFTSPFSMDLLNKVSSASDSLGIPVKNGGIVKTMPGPRFETKAEIRAMKLLGFNLVSMTHAYENILCVELGMDYLGLCICTNNACGLSESPLSQEEVFGACGNAKSSITRIIDFVVQQHLSGNQ